MTTTATTRCDAQGCGAVMRAEDAHEWAHLTLEVPGRAAQAVRVDACSSDCLMRLFEAAYAKLFLKNIPKPQLEPQRVTVTVESETANE